MKIEKYKPGLEKVLRLGEKGSVKSEVTTKGIRSILLDVGKNGDKALFKYTKRFDKYKLTTENIKVTKRGIKGAYTEVDKRFVTAVKHAYGNIKKFHVAQYKKIKKEWSVKIQDGIVVGEKINPIDSVGCYVPGGLASYPSTVLMTCVPAKIAGVKRIVITSPPPISPEVIVAADVCGVNEIYRIGGAQAIAAMAYGTKSIKKVSKIVGPGNKYVTTAKNLMYGIVDIDMPAGPSEILIIGDKTANPSFIAADLLAQAEHDPDARCVLVTSSRELANNVKSEITKQVKSLKRKKILKKSLKNLTVVITKDLKDAIKFANDYAPEHLEIMTKEPERIAKEIINAGAIFIGPYSLVAAGDYASGGNHVLPTGGAARFASQLTVRDFLKSSSFQKLSKKGLSSLQKTIEALVEAEGLDAHRKSVSFRLK